MTDVAMRLFEDPIELVIAREAAAKDLLYYSRFTMRQTRGVTWQVAKHHRIICDALMRVYRGECKRLIISCPPRYSKSQLLLNYVTWTMGHVPDQEVIFTSYSGELASTNSWLARDVVMSECYKGIFPHVDIDSRSTARDHWRTTKGGVVLARGAGAAITGFGAGKMRDSYGGAIIIDDPHKPDEALSEVSRPAVIRWYHSTLSNRANSPNTPIILIMQRCHEEDLAGYLLGGGSGEQWESVVLPALQPDGTALWPAKHTVEDLQMMERASPYSFAGQYQQSPAPEGGGMFRPSEMELIEARPAKHYGAVRAWDLAASVEGDYTVGVLLAKIERDRFAVLDVERFRGTPDVVEQKIVQTAQMDGRNVMQSLPVDPGQAGKAQALYLTRKLAGFRVQSSPETGDKITRAQPIAAQINVGNCAMMKAEWNKAFIHELAQFPFAKNDDQVDALSRAFMTLTARRGMIAIDDALLSYAAGRGR
jgi:predicted phage terminase large subunit-like protein